ncbi:hypothetical protein ACIBHX_38830 [Nonomuraea sp. NPDC050536]|uniref:hypothetical protein n=1 Tax=Nonomuraea sp. NPDC050536 TaxID=3364366 RepID=UPI0037C86953
MCVLIPVFPTVGAQTAYMVRDTPFQRLDPSPSSLIVQDTFYLTQGIAVNDRLLPVEADVTFQPGDLAAGIRLDGNGWLSGVPARAGTYSAPVRLCRAAECVDERITLVVLRNVPWEPGELTFPGRVGRPFDGEIAVNGGPQGVPATYTVTDDQALPDGVSIGPDGHVGGVPRKPGVSQVPVRICVAGNCAGVVVTLIVV